MDSFYFENMEEMISYVKFFKPGAQVAWAKGSEYLDQFKKGYVLFDQGRMLDAITEYEKALEYNPIGFSTRFEIIECYIQLAKFQIAKQKLLELSKLIIKDSDKARFYRRYGYIATEEQNYKLAFSCFSYSLCFEENSYVSNELAYLASIARINFKQINVKQQLVDAGLPLFTDDSASQLNSGTSSASQKQNAFSAFVNKYIK